MRKFIAFFVTISFLLMTSGAVTLSHADPVTQKIASEAAAKELAAQAGGTYVGGAAVPSLSGTQVALPVVSEATGEIIGYVVAEKASLISALNAAGYTSVASAIAAVEAGTAAGLAVGAGISGGTIALGAAVVAGTIALVVSATGGDGGTTTTHHH